MSTKDCYQVIGVNKTARQAEIKKAYHKLAMQYHPDRNSQDQQAEKKFKEISSAYDVLKDEQKKLPMIVLDMRLFIIQEQNRQPEDMLVEGEILI